MSKVTSVRLSQEQLDHLDEIAAHLERPRAWVIQQAVEQYLKEDAYWVAAVKEALDEYEAGTVEMIPHQEVFAEIDAMIRAKSNAKSND